MILSGASAYLVNEANLLDTIFLLYLKGPLINEIPLGAGWGQEQRAARGGLLLVGVCFACGWEFTGWSGAGW